MYSVGFTVTLYISDFLQTMNIMLLKHIYTNMTDIDMITFEGLSLLARLHYTNHVFLCICDNYCKYD